MRSREFEKPMSGVHYMNARPALCLSNLDQFLNRLSYRRRVGQGFEVCRIVVDSRLESESLDPLSSEAFVQLTGRDNRAPFLFGHLAMLAPFIKKLDLLLLRESLRALRVLEISGLPLASLPVSNHKLQQRLAIPLFDAAELLPIGCNKLTI